MEISDDALIKEIRGGESDSFAEIVERYKIQIYNLMYRYSGSAEDAADMTQDVFCRAFEAGTIQESEKFFCLALHPGTQLCKRLGQKKKYA